MKGMKGMNVMNGGKIGSKKVSKKTSKKVSKKSSKKRSKKKIVIDQNEDTFHRNGPNKNVKECQSIT